MVVGVCPVECLEEMLESELEAVFLQCLEITQLIRPFALHFGVGKRWLSEDLEIEFKALSKGLLEKAGPELQGITVTAGAEGGAQAVEVALDLCRTAQRCPHIPDRGEQSHQPLLPLGFSALSAVEHGTNRHQRCFAV